MCNGTLFCVELIVFTGTVNILPLYSLLCLELNVIRATVDIGHLFSVLCGVYCGYSNSSFGEMIFRFCLEFIVVTATVYIMQFCSVCL